ncbi:hypothetical protein SBADM41S_05806 [Streptomyces badius]
MSPALRASRARAQLTVVEPPSSVGAKPGGTLARLTLQFNPAKLSLSKSTEWRRTPSRMAGQSALPEFVGSGPRALSLEVFLDATATHDNSVEKAVEQLMTACVPTSQHVWPARRPPAPGCGSTGERRGRRVRRGALQPHHVLEPDTGYRTTVVVSASPDRSLSGLTAGANAPSRGPRMPGLAIGVVTDIREEGAGQRGWVRLKFPWLDDTYVTDWVRTVQWGGQGGGGVFSPEVNDEVLVGFEQGLLDSPYVLGGLYNGVDKPSPHDVPLVDPTSGKVNRRSLVSRSGNRLELLDAPRGPAGVRIATGDKRLDVVLDEKKGEITLTVKARGGTRELSSVTLSASGITLDAGATGDVNIKGRSVTVNGKTGVTVDGGLLAVLKAKLIRIN